MLEHLMIKQMFELVGQALTRRQCPLDPGWVDKVVDFIQVYADRTHHGKEEGILFPEVQKKQLSGTGRLLLAGLVADHLQARAVTMALAAANLRCRQGDKTAASEVAAHLQALVETYPQHLLRENEVFFPAARAYFTAEESLVLLERLREFDCRLIHEKYGSVLEELAAPVPASWPCQSPVRQLAACSAR